MANEYVRGQTIRLAIKVRLVDGSVPTGNPTTVTIRVTDPEASSTDYTLGAGQVTLDTALNPFGDYYYDLSTAGLADAKCGTWIYAGITTGTPASAEKNSFRLVSEKLR